MWQKKLIKHKFSTDTNRIQFKNAIEIEIIVDSCNRIIRLQKENRHNITNYFVHCRLHRVLHMLLDVGLSWCGRPL